MGEYKMVSVLSFKSWRMNEDHLGFVLSGLKHQILVPKMAENGQNRCIGIGRRVHHIWRIRLR